MANKTALVFGHRGQDGSFMCDLLKSKGYHVETDLAKLIGMDEVYNFAGVSDVIDPFANVARIMEVNTTLPIKILDTIARQSPKTKFFQASSCLVFGNNARGVQNEDTPPNPLYPYGVSKLAADMMIREYRNRFGIFAVSGVFFPHISERQKDHFFAKKIVKAAVNKQPTEVGDLSPFRDWGYAPNYMEAAWLMMQRETPSNYVIGTGSSISLRQFVERAFAECGLNYLDYVTETASSRDEQTMEADSSAIRRELGWYPKTNIFTIIKKMIEHERTLIAG